MQNLRVEKNSRTSRTSFLIRFLENECVHDEEYIKTKHIILEDSRISYEEYSGISDDLKHWLMGRYTLSNNNGMKWKHEMTDEILWLRWQVYLPYARSTDQNVQLSVFIRMGYYINWLIDPQLAVCTSRMVAETVVTATFIVQFSERPLIHSLFFIFYHRIHNNWLC